jgi:hypothetical protein
MREVGKLPKGNSLLNLSMGLANISECYNLYCHARGHLVLASCYQGLATPGAALLWRNRSKL